jgi:polysaccharide pyruvyl transferase WcaK-like protein
MNFALPRYISGNRGDIASRWGLLRALHNLGEHDGTVFCVHHEDAPQGLFRSLPCGKYHNLVLNRDGRNALAKADTIVWGVGLDMQDDSSLARLLYLRVLFGLYRQMGKRIWCLFQGAGPVTTSLGSMLARQALNQTDCFVARDPGTLNLLQRLSPSAKIHLGYDAIFLPGFEVDLEPSEAIPAWYQALWAADRPVVGLNIRQWFHFSSSLLPYEFSKKKYLARSLPKMEQLLDTVTGCVRQLRQRFQARLLLISAYQPGAVPWEDDLTWLERLKARFAGDPEVMLVNETIPMPLYYQLMSRLDLMIGMRLHSSLIALRFGVPAINLSYTLKGKDIYDYLGLGDNVVALPDVLDEPDCIINMADRILSDAGVEREKTRRVVAQAIEKNSQLLCEILKSH